MWLIVLLLSCQFFNAFGNPEDYDITTGFEIYRPGATPDFTLRNDLGYAEVGNFERVGIQPHSGNNLLYSFGGIVLGSPPNVGFFKTISFWYYLPSPVATFEVDYTDPLGGPFKNTAALVNNPTPNSWQHLTAPLPRYVQAVVVKAGPNPVLNNFALDDVAYTLPEPRLSVLISIGLGIFLLRHYHSRIRG